jgi:transcriptional regulator with XRE-family HTH domain
MAARIARTVGDNIRRIRLAKEISQKELARRCDFSQSTLCDIERGYRKAKPSVGRLPDIARALGVEIAKLFEGVR